MTHANEINSEVEMKQAAGGEFVAWSNASGSTEAKSVHAKILSFPQMPHQESAPSQLEALGVLSAEKQAEIKRLEMEAQEKAKPDVLDFILSERHRFKSSEEKIFKQKGLASYKKNADMRLYQITLKDESGLQKTKVTSVLGVLVDKKQN
jgi:hypothetical protein